MTIISVSLHPPKKAILRKEVKSLFLCKMHTTKFSTPQENFQFTHSKCIYSCKLTTRI